MRVSNRFVVFKVVVAEVVDSGAGVYIRVPAKCAPKVLPIVPAVFGIDVIVAAALGHFVRVIGAHHNAGRIITNSDDLFEGQRLAFFVLYAEEQGRQSGNKDRNEFFVLMSHGLCSNEYQSGSRGGGQ